MNKYLCLIVLTILPIESRATDFLPAINKLPLLDRYATPQDRDAARTFQQGVFIALGIDDEYNVMRQDVNKRLTNTTKDTKSVIVQFLDETPINSKYVMFGLAATYMMVSQKTYTHRFKNSWNKDVQHYVSVSPDKFMTGINLSF